MSVDASERSRASAPTTGQPHRRYRVVGGVLLAGALSAALLAGCKQSGDNNQAAGSARPSTSASPSASASPSGSPSAAGSPSASTGAPRRSAAPPTTKPGGDLETHTGTVTRGVEPGCTILKASDGNYELVGADATAKHALQPDARVVVRGYQEHGVMSHCMQGKMLKVVSAHAAN